MMLSSLAELGESFLENVTIKMSRVKTPQTLNDSQSTPETPTE